MKIISKIIIILFLLFSINTKADTLDVPVQYSSIQLALDNAESNDVILVQPGIYYENIIWPLINGIDLIVSCDTCSTSFTIIDGGNLGRVISMYSDSILIDTSTIIKGFTLQHGFVPDTLNLKGAGIYINNCSPKLINLNIRNNTSNRYAVYGVGMYFYKSKSVLEKIKISHCEVAGYSRVYGGGLYADSSHLVIDSLQISNQLINTNDRSYGSGIFVSNSFIHIVGFDFCDNNLEIKFSTGGALYAESDTLFLNNFTINNNSFEDLHYEDDNNYHRGGGVYINNCTGELYKGSIKNNKLKTVSNYSGAEGGGIYIENFSDINICKVACNYNTIETKNWATGAGAYIGDHSVVGIDSCSFDSNTLRNDLWTYGCGIYLTDSSSANINHSTVNNNLSDNLLSGWIMGIGIYSSSNSTLILKNSFISDNSSVNGLWLMGGGIYARSSQIKLINTVISNNIFGLDGNWYYGGGLYVEQESDVIVINSTITRNRKADSTSMPGSGILLETSHLDLINSICINNTPSKTDIALEYSTKTVAYSNTKGFNPGPGNIDADPLFVSTTDFHLQDLSPCINAGNPDTTGLDIPAVDIEGNPRIIGNNIDMGAYENQNLIIGVNTSGDNEIEIFPNPTHGIFFINGNNLLNVQVLNEIGQVIMGRSNQTKIDLSSYPNGIYLIKITMEKKTIIRKLIKL